MSPRQKFTTIDEYIESFPQSTKIILEKVRQVIKKTVPQANETISYQIPAFKLNAKYIIYFAGFTKHISLYPAPREHKDFKEELKNYKGGKGTVQFPLDRALPWKLIERIVRFRIRENETKNSTPGMK